MQIHILQKAISIDNVFSIAVNNKKKYLVRGDFSSYCLFSNDNVQLLSIFRQWFSLFPRFNIYFNSTSISSRKEPLKFITRSYFKNEYYCKWDEDEFNIYVHKALKYSIFKNGEQIAGINQERWSSFNEDGFRMECNNDCHKEFMIALTIILDQINNNKFSFLYGLFNYNLGVILESKAYENDWKPK